MSTHVSPCLMCGEPTYCCDDTHVLGIEISTHPGHCAFSPVTIGEFCSVSCFMALHDRWDARRKIALAEYPELFEQGKVNHE